jgi:hypothetical protein
VVPFDPLYAVVPEIAERLSAAAEEVTPEPTPTATIRLVLPATVAAFVFSLLAEKIASSTSRKR